MKEKTKNGKISEFSLKYPIYEIKVIDEMKEKMKSFQNFSFETSTLLNKSNQYHKICPGFHTYSIHPAKVDLLELVVFKNLDGSCSGTKELLCLQIFLPQSL